MASKVIINSILVLRIFSLMFFAASISLTVTNSFNDAGTKFKFSDIKSYRYVLAVGAAGALYTLIQLPFAIYHAVKEKRTIGGKFLPIFDFYGDKAISFEYKDVIDSVVDAFEHLGVNGLEDFRSKSKKFCDREILASCILLGGFVTMAILCILTSLNKSLVEKHFINCIN